MTICKLLGVFCIFLSIYVAFDTIIKIMRCSQKTEGRLVSLDVRAEMDAGKKWRNYFVPVYTYTVKGVEYQGAGKEYRLKPDFDMNKTYEIRYNPLDPKEFIANKKTGNIYVCAFFFCLGVILILLSYH